MKVSLQNNLKGNVHRSDFFMLGQVGVVVSCLAFRFESRQGHYVDWIFSPYLTAWVLPGGCGFTATSKTEISSSSSLLVWL